MNRLSNKIWSQIGWLGRVITAPWLWIWKPSRKTMLVSCAVACGLPLLALGAGHWLEPLSGHTSYQLFLGAVALSAMYGGIGSGLCTLALSALLKYHFFLAPHLADTGAAILRLLLFIALGLMITWLAGTLRSTQQHLHAALRFIGEAVVLTNSRKQVTFMNAVAEVLTGWERKQAVGRDFNEVVLLLEEDRTSAVIDPLERAFREGAAIDIEKPLILQSTKGASSLVEGSLAPIRNRVGKIVGSITALRDISERLVWEAELRTAEKIQALGRLTGPLAHDFNNWLTVISGHAELVRGRLTDVGAPALRESVEAILKASDEAGRLARQFLVFNCGPAAPRGRVDINRVIHRMEPAIRTVLGDYVSVIMALGQGVWPAKVAPEQVEQIVINLVANARAAMPKGGVLEIRTRNGYLPGEGANERSPCVILEVSDDGCGMDAETKSKIFEPFFSTKTDQRGAGLGLSLVYSIVVQSGGRIEVSSDLASGSTFQVYLPRFEEDQVARNGAASLVKPVRLTMAPLVLVVDSDDGVRKLIVSTLEAENYSVLQAADGRQALEIAAQNINHLDLVVTELTTPEVTGPELATRLSLLRPDIKLVYVSSYPKPAAWDKNGSEPNRAFLFKPFSPAELLTQVELLLSVKPSRR